MSSNRSGNLTDIQVMKVRILTCPLKKLKFEIEIKSSTLFKNTYTLMVELGRHTTLRRWHEVIVVCEFKSH